MVVGVGGALSLDLRPNIPRNVECFDGLHVYPDQCTELLATMPASPSPPQVFGSRAGPGITQVLPKVFTSGRKLLFSPILISERHSLITDYYSSAE